MACTILSNTLTVAKVWVALPTSTVANVAVGSKLCHFSLFDDTQQANLGRQRTKVVLLQLHVLHQILDKVFPWHMPGEHVVV